MNRPTTLALVFAAALAATGCGRHRDVYYYEAPQPAAPVLISIEAEVYDPVTDFVWENVGVRIVESYCEWSDVTRVNPLVDDWFYTDAQGLVFFSERDLADANVGFVEDSLRRAILEPEFDRDQAIVTLEVWAPGFASTFVEVELDWRKPDAFVSVPFE